MFTISTRVILSEKEAPRWHLLFTGVPPFAPYANYGIDLGYDFLHFSKRLYLNAKFSGQLGTSADFDSDTLIGHASSAKGIDASINLSYKLKLNTGQIVFFLGPSVGAFIEKKTVKKYIDATSYRGDSLRTDTYKRTLWGYNWGIFYQTDIYPAFLFGMSWTGLLNDSIKIPYTTTSGATGVYDTNFLGANTFEFFAGIKL